ncbi:Ketoreductase CTB6, partial [Hyphodiscus hymeniophilus]
ITGTTGMVGFAVLTATLNAGYRVRIAVRKEQDTERVRQLAPVNQYETQIESTVVPDITVPGAYDAAVKDVDFIIHVASPVAVPPVHDYEKELIQPAGRGTLGILESASREPGVKRVVFTASVVSVIPAKSVMTGGGDVTYNEKHRVSPQTEGYSNLFEGYMASKVHALKVTEDFIRDRNPSFDVISIGPGFVIGRDNTVTEVAKITKGSNGLLIGQLLGEAAPFSLSSIFTHIDDVALLHVKSLDPAIKGNQYFMVTAEGPDGPTWAEALNIVKRHYPKEVYASAFHFDTPASTAHIKTDSSHTEKTFGMKFKTLEQATVDLVDHYLELMERR